MRTELETIEEIKAAVDAGHAVHCGNDGYTVTKDSIGQYLIKYAHNNYCVGLHGMEGTKYEGVLNGGDFYSYPLERKFNVYIHLHGEYTAADDGAAFELAMNDIEHRHGMDIMKHEIIEA